MGLARLAIVNLTRKRAMAAVQLAGLVTAIALAVALPLMQAVAAEEGLRSALAAAGNGTNLEVSVDQIDNRTQFDDFEGQTSRQVTAQLGAIVIPGARFVRSNLQQPASLNGVELVPEKGETLPDAAYYENLEQHVIVTSGSWPADARSGQGWPVTISETGASLLGLKVGDVYCVGSRGASIFAPPPWCADIAAVWKPKSARDPYWGGQVPGIDLMLGPNSLFSINNPYMDLHASQIYVTDVPRVHAADASGIEDHLQQLRGEYSVSSNATFISGLGNAIQIFLSRLRAQQELAVSVEIALLAVALFAIGLGATHYLDVQKPLIGLWRARGGSRLRAWGLLMIQLGLLTLVAIPAGALIGIAVVSEISSRLFGRADVFTGGIVAGAAPTLVVALIAILVVLAMLAADATRRTVSEVRRTESRPAVTAWWQRRWIDLAFAVGGVLIVVEYRAQASQPTSTTGQDPLGLILPGIALALLAVSALRLLPFVATALARGSDVGSRLARWRLERQPLQHARIALLLSFTLALGVFTSAYLATDQRNAIDRARYAAGSDVRITYGFDTAPSELAEAVAATPGVVATSLAFRDIGEPGLSNVSTTVMGIDPYTFPAAADWRSDYADKPLEQLMGMLSSDDPDGLALPGRPKAISIWAYSSGFNAVLSADLNGKDGRPVHVSFGNLGTAGWNQLQAPLNGVASNEYPLTLRTLAITPSGLGVSGEVDVSQLRAGPAGSSAPVVEAFAAPDGWWNEEVGQFGGVVQAKVGPRLHDGETTVLVSVASGGGTVELHPAASSNALPALISTQTAARLGVGVGQSFPLHIETNDVNVHIVGAIDYFPTLYPGEDDFIVLPGESLEERLRAQNQSAYPTEAWLRVSGSTEGAALATEKATRGLAQVVDRESLESAALSSPLRLSLDAALLMGFVAALAMVLVSFGLHFLALARGRVSESAIMQANGLPWSVVDRGLFIEELVVLGYSVVVGAALGAALAWAILPVLQTSAVAAELIPPTVVALDARTLIGSAVALLVAAAIVGQLGIRSASRFRLPDELRSLA